MFSSCSIWLCLCPNAAIWFSINYKKPNMCRLYVVMRYTVVLLGIVGVVWNVAGMVWSCIAKFCLSMVLLKYNFHWLVQSSSKQGRALTASHLTEQFECVSWWPWRFGDSRLISISADLPELTGVIVPVECLLQRRKTYSFIKSQWIVPLELYVCSGLFP